MKMRNKGGRVHPSPSSSAASSASSAASPDVLAILKLLPAAILTLASFLSLQDKEVLAYMITRSLKPTINPSNILEEKFKKNPNPNSKNNRNNNVSHRPPMFDCECFDCYTSYWSKWNSSPNRELIHQAIETFEEHLNTNNGELSSSPSKNKGRNKRRDKLGRRGAEKIQENEFKIQECCKGSLEIQECGKGLPEIQECGKGSPGIQKGFDGSLGRLECVNGSVLIDEKEVVEEMVIEVAPAVCTVVVAAGCGSSHKGLARKVLPDVLGLLNSRLWSLWSPNV